MRTKPGGALSPLHEQYAAYFGGRRRGRSRAAFRLGIAGAVAMAGLALTLLVSAQNSALNATRDDWEEINFVFGSSALVDGFPDLIRLADLVRQHPGYRVRLYGYADAVGTNAANEAVSKARAERVKTFLLHRGVKPEQLDAIARGSREPEASNQTKEGRFINRRVRIQVTDEKGREVGAGSSLIMRLQSMLKERPKGETP